MLALLLSTILQMSLTTGQEMARCLDVNLRANVSVPVGQDVSLQCDQDQCPPASRITWFRSDTLDNGGARYPLVSDHPTMLTISEAMPEDSGWYWCQTDSYQVVAHVQVGVGPQPLPPLVPSPLTGSQRKGTADQLQVYDTYQSNWQDKQRMQTKMLEDLESVIAQYLRPVNLQLEDIYKRLSSLERKVYAQN